MWEQDVFRIHTDVIQCIDSTTYSSELSDEVHFAQNVDYSAKCEQNSEN